MSRPATAGAGWPGGWCGSCATSSRRPHGYEAVYLHTDPAVSGAEPFWRSLADEVCDERALPGGGQGIVHFELPMPVPTTPAR